MDSLGLPVDFSEEDEFNREFADDAEAEAHYERSAFADGDGDADIDYDAYEYGEDQGGPLPFGEGVNARPADSSRRAGPSRQADLTTDPSDFLQQNRKQRGRSRRSGAPTGRPSKTHRVDYSDRAQRAGGGHYQQPSSVAPSDSDDGGTDDSADAATTGPTTQVDAHCMGDYNAAHFGYFLTARVPEFRHGSSSNSTWMSYSQAESEAERMCPIRALCWNIPAELFSLDSTRFRHWTTPEKNPMRASNIASVLSFCFTGTSKGFLSGQHEELQRANGESDDGQDDEKKKKQPSRVHRYAFMLPTDNNVTVPMFTIAYEELYNTELTKVTAIRVWKFVFDESHSDSELCRKLLDENRDTVANAGAAHAPNTSRRKQLVVEQKQNRMQMGGLKGGHQLEYFAGMQYAGIINEEVWYRRLVSYGGKNMHNEGRPFFNDARLPRGINNKRIQPNPTLGGTHPYSPEYVFNARREMSFKAGTVSLETNEPLDIHPDFLDPSKYWTDRYEFTLPQVSRKHDGFFFLVNSYVTNIFDAPLPRPIYGTASAGPHLLKLYRERFYDQVQAAGGTNASVADCFNGMMTKQDLAAVDMAKQMSETIIAYDSIDATELERKGLRHYGELDASNSYIIEPRQVIKTIASETRRVQAELLQPWLKEREALCAAKNAEIKKLALRQAAQTTGDGQMDIDYHDERMNELRALEDATTQRHCEVMKDLIILHLSRIEDAFRSKIERETIPQGWLAMYDGLYDELSRMPNGTASVAFAFNRDLAFDDTSSFAQTNLALGQFFENDCFIEGRDRRIMDELFLHLFEQYGDVTFLLLLCGYKGNGKTLRTERAMAVFPKDWITTGGPASARAGMNGQSDSTNGKNVIYDEMVDELCESDGSDRLEFWKQIVLKREYTYNRTMSVKNLDGSESHKTMKLRTPHDETHCICTNYGMAFTKNTDPTDTKFAMIDRSIAHLVRSIGKKAHTDSEFNDHMSKPEQQQKLSAFRIFVCLVGATKLAIKNVPAFQPNFALANKIFDYLDNDMIVGEYNLPRCSPRKSLKREENLRTLCTMKAVADVFLYRQTAIEFDAGCLGPDGEPQPFKFSMLYDVIRQLRATPELIFHAWSQSLDYNIGTAGHTFAAMTALCEHFGLTVGDWFKKPRPTDLDDIRHAPPPPSPSRVPVDAGAAGSERERQEAIQTASMRLDANAVRANMAQMPQLFGPNGVSRSDREFLLRGFERQRRALSLYRHTCTLDGNSDLRMDDPISTIEKVMKRHGTPHDASEAIAEASSSPCEYMPIYSSSIMASTVQVCCLYNYQSVVDWCSNNDASYQQIDNFTIGTSKVGERITYSQRASPGPCQWNTAWFRKEAADWKNLANDTIHSNNTCKIFDLPSAGLRDLFYLLSTRDNARRCTEEPKLPIERNTQNAFTTLDHTKPPDGYMGNLRMRGIKDSRGRDEPVDKGADPRHPYACIEDMELQRIIDFRSNHGRYPAMMPMLSNNVRDVPPVRMVSKDDKRYVELNTAAAIAHTKMLAEASFRCSLHPGMENMQEVFCGGTKGPEGTVASADDAAASSSANDDYCSKFAWSYDLLHIAFTLDAMGRYYNPEIDEYCQMYKDAFGDSLGINPTIDDLPHMCLRFVGFEDTTIRRHLSMEPRKERSPSFKPIEVGDDAENVDDHHTVYTYLQLSLGHEPSDEEIDRYMKSRAGSRAMSGVTGDLMSMTTYFHHTLTTLKERGMVSGEDDIVMHLVADDPYGLRMRVAEAAGRKINELVDAHDDMKRAYTYNPPNYEHLSPERLKQARDMERHRVRTKLYASLELPDELDQLRKYAPLNVGELRKNTYQNVPKDKQRIDGKDKGQAYTSVDASSQFKNHARFRDKTIPGKGKEASRRTAGAGLHVGGRRDARVEAARASCSRDA